MKYKNPHPAAWRFNASHKKGVDFTWKEICFWFFFPIRIILMKRLPRPNIVTFFYMYISSLHASHIHRHNCMDIIILHLFTIVIFPFYKKRKIQKKPKTVRFFSIRLYSSFDCAIYFLVMVTLLVVGSWKQIFWHNLMMMFFVVQNSHNSSEPIRYVIQCINYIF